MDIQTKILNALADFDDLLVRGHPIDYALRIAAAESGVSERILQSRASRGMSLEERRNLVTMQAKRDRKTALQASTDKAGSRREGYWVRSPSGKKTWFDPSQSKFDF